MILRRARKAAVILISVLLYTSGISAQNIAWGEVAWNDPTRKDAPEAQKLPKVYPIAGGAAVLGVGAWLLLKDSDGDDDPTPADTLDDCTIDHEVATEPAICTSATGSAQIIPTEEGVSATWPDGLDTLNRDDLEPGSYTVTLSNDSCSQDIVIDVPSEEVELQLAVEQVTEPSGPDAMNGSFVIILENAKAPPFTFSLNEMQFEPSPEPVFSQNELGFGEYVISVTDDRGCTGEIDIFLGGVELPPHGLDQRKSQNRIRVIWVPWNKLYPAPDGR